jgi:hypothetical protein
VLGIVREEGFIARKASDGEPYFVAALLRITGKERRKKKKQVPHPSALRAYGLRMTRKETA